jgi:hypothetical protein
MNTLDILATLLAQVLLNKLGLSTYHLAAVVPLMAAMLGYLTTNQSLIGWFQSQISGGTTDTNNDSFTNSYGLSGLIPSTTTLGWCALLGFCGWLTYKWWRTQFIMIEINRTSSVDKIITYITLNKEKFSRFPSMINADANILVYNSLEITNEFTNNYMKPGQTLYFRNTLFGSGYLTTHLRYISCDRNPSSSGTRVNNDYESNNSQAAARYTSVRIPIYSCQLNILRSSVNPSMFDNLDTILDNDNLQRNREAPFIKLVNYKIHANQNPKKKMMPISIVEYTTYQGRNRTLSELEPIYMATHFHTEKDRLWSLIKEIDQNKDYYQKYGQTPKLNLLLHGPPGTGKSSFAYRVAMTLRRDIISMDLTKYPNRYIIDKLMHGYINVCLSNGHMISPSRLVYVFDEFDRTIEFLIAAQDKEKRLFESKLKSMSAGNGLAALLGSAAGKKSKSNPKTNNSSDSDGEEDDFTIPSVDDSVGDPSTSISAASQLLTIKDLLEIFQGVVDVDSRLIFAMTNHYDKIKQECPALFRPGRLTPVYFGYIGRETLVDIIQYYFKTKSIPVCGLDSLPSELRIPTSEIIEQAIYFSGRGADGYSKFMQWLQVRCQEKPS